MDKKWIWQSERYPHFLLDKSYTIFDFTFDDCLGAIFDRLVEHEKKLNQIISQSSLSPILLESKITALTDEIVNSASIEGEILKRESVRSSLRKKLDKEFNFINDNSATKQSDNYASILLDTNLNKNPLTIERLHGWHNCLFESGYSGLHKINIAKFRNDEMQVISGGIGKEKIHYEAIPAKNIQNDMQAFLRYCNNDFINPYAKSAIAHLWFVIIHPYDDGNGRIARAIADFALPNKNVKLYSISSQINAHKKAYYEILERTNRFNANCDITEWLQWHLSITESAMQKGIDKINQIIFKTKFWDNFKELRLTRSQHKVLGKMLDIGIKDFGGFLSAKKYSRISKVDIQTANKEIDELCKFGCLVKKTNSFSNEFFALPQDFAAKPLDSNSKLKQKEYTLVRSGIEPHIEEQAPSLPSGSSLTSGVNVSKNTFKSQATSSAQSKPKLRRRR